MKTNLLLDCNNLAHRVLWATQNETDEDSIGIILHKILTSLNKFYKKYNADNVIVAFDAKSWRKAWMSTANTEKVSHKGYKAHRKDKLTQSQLQKLAMLNSSLNDLAQLFREQTGIIVLKDNHLEADDLISHFISIYNDQKNVIISSDKDFLQLLSNSSVTLIDPLTDKARDLSEWDHDAKYFMFEKCFRGDVSDNIISAYPNLRSTKIKEAYTDEFKRTNIMNHEFIVESLDAEGKLKEHKYTTGKLFEENKLLMDLTYQPDYIKELMEDSIQKSIETRGTFNYFSFIKFLGKHNLQAILKDVDKFVPLLTGKGKGIL